MENKPREVTDLSSDLINFGWSKEDAESTADAMQALPKFRTFNSYYLAAALELKKRLDMAKQKPKKPEDYAKIVNSILAAPSAIKSKSKRRQVKTQEVKDKEPYTVVSYYLSIPQSLNSQKSIYEEFLSEEDEEEEEDDVGIADDE